MQEKRTSFSLASSLEGGGMGYIKLFVVVVGVDANFSREVGGDDDYSDI